MSEQIAVPGDPTKVGDYKGRVTIRGFARGKLQDGFHPDVEALWIDATTIYTLDYDPPVHSELTDNKTKTVYIITASSREKGQRGCKCAVQPKP